MSSPDTKSKNVPPHILKQNKEQNNYAKLKNARIIQSHLIYVIGLSSKVCDEKTLQRYEYFGQYGNIKKIVINKTKAYNHKSNNGVSYSAYITYSTPFEASISILAVDNYNLDGYNLRASYGTTKYCTYFLKGYQCPNPNCIFFHYFADPDEVINKDDLVFDKGIFTKQNNLAIKITKLFSDETMLNLSSKKEDLKLPSPYLIYSRDIFQDYMKEKEIHKKIEDSQVDNQSSNGSSGKLPFLKSFSESMKISEPYGSSFTSIASKLTSSTNDKSFVNDTYFMMEDSPKKSFKKGIFERAPFSRLNDIVKLENENKEEMVEIPEFVDEFIKKGLSSFVRRSNISNDLNSLTNYTVKCEHDEWATWINRLQQI